MPSLPPALKRPLARLDRWLREPLHPRVGFALSRTRLLGAALASKEVRLAARAAVALPPGALEPSFDRVNLPRPGLLEERVREAARRLGAGGADIVLLPPEACFKSFVLAFDEFPAAAEERQVLLRHRLDKLMPARPEDVRMSFDVRPGDGRIKVFLSLARIAVIEEYERLFALQGLRPRAVGPPSLGLAGCVPGEPGRRELLADIDEDGIGLLALDGPDVVLHRYKPFHGAPGEGATGEAGLALAAAEIENTLHFLEDREAWKDGSVRIRSTLKPAAGEAPDFLGARLSVPVGPAACPVPSDGAAADTALFAPLLGYLQ
jgi:hypothetical protein